MKSIFVALFLLFSLTANAASPPCNPDDNECLLRKVLEGVNELEAANLRLGHCQRSNDLLQEALKQEQNRPDGGRVFVMGMVTGVVFVGLISTIVLKAVKS